MDELPAEEILRVAQSHGVVGVWVFGSRARGDAARDSDLDLLVDVQPGTTLIDLMGFERELEDLLGVRVEASTERALHPRLKARILAEAKPLVAA